MALGTAGPVLECARLHYNDFWFREDGELNHVTEYIKTTPSLYLHDTPVPDLLENGAIHEGPIFDLGTWGYREFLELSPTSAWAILRARYFAETHGGDDPGKVFETHLRELLSIIMPVGQISSCMHVSAL